MNLLNRTILYYVVFSIMVFALGSYLIHRLASVILVRQMSQSLMFEEQLIEDKLLSFGEIPKFNTTPGHIVDIQYHENPLRRKQVMGDTVINNPFTQRDEDYLYLKETGSISDSTGFYRGYTIIISRSFEDTNTFLARLIMIIWLVFILLIIVLGLFNFWISRRVWKPFYGILESLSAYDPGNLQYLELPPSETDEFNTLNQALTAMSEKINRNFGELKELVEDITHEIKAPVTIIRSNYEQLLQSDNLTEPKLKHLKSINDAAARLSRLNNTLNLISHKNTRISSRGEVDLISVVHSFLLNFDDVIQSMGLRVSEQIVEKPTVPLTDDLADILVSNMLGNAIKHNVQGGSIHIRLTAKEFTVVNTGKVLDRHPDQMFRRHEKSETKEKSPGLGLSIIKKIVEIHQMKIQYSTDRNMHTLTLYF